MKFDVEITDAAVTLTPKTPSVIGRLIAKKQNLTAPIAGDQDLSLVLGDLAALDEEIPGSALVLEGRIILKHDAVSRMDGATARALGLPPLPDLTLATDVEGVVGNSDFRLRYRWIRDGMHVPSRRTGSILHTADGDYRIPRDLLDAITLADAPSPPDLSEQWNMLARFRRALLGANIDQVGGIAMTEFLTGLEVHLASGFSIEPRNGNGGLDFEVRAHSDRGPGSMLVEVDQCRVSSQIRDRGSLPAYRLAAGSFLVVDLAARTVLDVMTRMHKAEPRVREAFVRNPLRYITEAVEDDLAASSALDQLGDADRQDVVERATAAFVETDGYADRVEGIGEYAKPVIDFGPGSGVTWLPEEFNSRLREWIRGASTEDLLSVRDQAAQAENVGGMEIRAGEAGDHTGVEEIDAEIKRRGVLEEEEEGGCGAENGNHDHEDSPGPPQILLPGENFEQLAFFARNRPRSTERPNDLPQTLLSSLFRHQIDGLHWAQAAWKSGLPGILNADEQGLGKTVQTIAFLAWLKECLEAGDGPVQGPVLVVAPTSLLETWEGEVARHLEEPGLGALVRLYGSGLSGFRRAGIVGRETKDAVRRLDFRVVHEAIKEKRGHRLWLLTTYQTLTNYQYSLGRIPFSSIVFDEIQALKNPGTMAAKAAKAMNGDFRIGLTGTPVENAVTDLWAILDQLVPGYLGTLKDFRAKFETAEPNTELLAELNQMVFEAKGPHPPIGLRRLKEHAASYLPEKSRYLHPNQMPSVQAKVYESARLTLAEGGFSAVLKMLHRIRGVSLHPDPGMTEGFENASARLRAGLKILDRIRDAGERVLVFIEDRRMQYRFIALARSRYGIERIDLINGSTPIRQRQEIVDRFQESLGIGGFNILVLGPRAAGTGLTLTAATHVLHLSRWWNPAVEEQCNDRVHRIGQKSPVAVHVPLAVHPRYGLGSFDCQLQLLMERKRRLARKTLFPAGESSSDVNSLRDSLLEGRQTTELSLDSVMNELFVKMGIETPKSEPDGSYRIG